MICQDSMPILRQSARLTIGEHPTQTTFKTSTWVGVRSGLYNYKNYGNSGKKIGPIIWSLKKTNITPAALC